MVNLWYLDGEDWVNIETGERLPKRLLWWLEW